MLQQLMDTEYVDADEFEALEALLHSAERKLDPSVAGCKRQAAVSPATLKLQEQHAAEQAAHSKALFQPAAHQHVHQASTQQQLDPILVQQQHKQLTGTAAVAWPAASVPWVGQGLVQQQPCPQQQLQKQQQQQHQQTVTQAQPPQHQQACEVQAQPQAAQHLPHTQPGQAFCGPGAAGIHPQGQHAAKKQHHQLAHGPSLQDCNNPKWHVPAQQQSRDMHHHLQQQGRGSISGAILPGSTAGSGANSSGKAVTTSSSVPQHSTVNADAAAAGSASDAAKGRTHSGPTAGAGGHLPLHTNSRGSSGGNIPAGTVAGKQTGWCSNASAVAPSADKAAGSSAGMCAPLACAAGTQGQPQALAPASSSGNAVASAGSVQGSGAGAGNDACPYTGSSGGAHAQAVPGGNGAGAGPGPSSSLGAPAGAAVVNNSVHSKPAVGNSAGHGCQQVSGWSVQQQWSTAGGGAGSSGVAAHQRSSSVSFGSGGNSRRYTGSTGSGAHTAGIKRSNSWSVGQWQQQQQQQGAAQVQQQSWHHWQQQIGPRHHQQPHQQQYGQAQQASMAPPQQRQQQPQWQQHRQQHAQHGIQQQASPQVQQEVTAGHPGAPPQASPQIQQQQQQQAPGQCIQPVAPLQRQQQRQQQQQQQPGGPVSAALAAGGSGGMAWQGHANAAPCSGGAAMHSGLPNVPGRESQQHGMQPAGSGGRSASAGPAAAAAAAGVWSGGSTTIAAPAAGAWSGGSNAIAGAAAATAAAAGAAGPGSGGGTIPAGPPPAGAAAGARGGGSGGLSTNSGRRKLPSSLGSHGSGGPGSGGGGGGGSGGSARGAAGSGGVGGSGGYRPQQQQQQQRQQQWGRPRGPKQLPWAGSVVYAHTPADVDYACKQMQAAGPPAVIGFDVEWKPSFMKGAPPNKAALIQLAYFCQGGQDCRTKVEEQGRGVIVLLLHIKHSGITKKLQEVLLDDQIVKLGVNIGGDVLKLGADYNVQVFGALDLSDTAHGHQLRAVEGVTANVQPKKWSLAGLIDEVFSLELPKPQHIRMGDWERKPLTREQQRYAAMDAYACLLLHWELQNLPTKKTLQQKLIDAMRQRAAAGDDSDDDVQ